MISALFFDQTKWYNKDIGQVFSIPYMINERTR